METNIKSQGKWKEQENKKTKKWGNMFQTKGQYKTPETDFSEMEISDW